MNYISRYVFILFFLLNLNCKASNRDAEAKDPISIYTYHPKANQPHANSLEQLFKEGKFKKSERDIIIERNNTLPVWVAIKLPSIWKEGEYKIVIEDCFIDKLEYICDTCTSNSSSITGALFPFHKREIEFSFFTFSIKKEQPKDSLYFFSFQNIYHNSVVPIKVYSVHDFQKNVNETYLLWGFYIGIIVLTMFVALWMIVIYHAKIFIYVFFTILFNLIWVLFNNGLGFQFIWPNHPELMQTGRFIAYQLSILFIYICFELFIHKKYNINKYKKIQQFFIIALSISIFLGFNPFQLDNRSIWFSTYFYFSNFLQLSILVYIIVNVLKEIQNKNVIAWFYVVSFLILFISHIGLILIKYNIINPYEWMFNVNYIGIFIQVISLVVGLLLDFELQKRELNKKILMAQEEERHRIAIDMHDEIGSSLSTIKIISELELKRNDNPTSKTAIQKIHQKTVQINQKIKEIIWTLQSVNDNIESLIEYINTYAQSYFDDLHIELINNIPPVIPNVKIDGMKRRHILLVLKEIFQNIIKHTKSTQVGLEINIDKHALHIIISDNGNGDPEHWIWGNGLKNINERIKIVNGSILYKKEKGVRYQITIPI